MSDNDAGMRPLRAAVAEEIQILLLRRKSNPTQLAKRLGWSQSYMSRRIVGDSAFDVDDLERIAAALDVPITELFPRRGQGNVSVGSEPASVTVSGNVPWSDHPVLTGAMTISPVTRVGGPPPSPTRTYPTGR